MTADIQTAARRLLDVIDAPSGVVGVVAWPDIVLPSIRVFVVAGIRLPVSAVPTEFEGFPVEVVTRGDAMPFRAGSADTGEAGLAFRLMPGHSSAHVGPADMRRSTSGGLRVSSRPPAVHLNVVSCQLQPYDSATLVSNGLI